MPGQEVPRCIEPSILPGLYLLFDLQEPAAESPSHLTTARPGQLGPAPLPLPSAAPAFSSKLLAQLSLFTCFQIQGGRGNIKQTWALLKWLEDAIRSRGCVVPLRFVCLSLLLVCRPLTIPVSKPSQSQRSFNHSNFQSHPNLSGAALTPLQGWGGLC